MNRSDSVLILTPTERERRGLDPTPLLASIELCGFGPVAAGVRAAQLIAERRPIRVILVGISGTYDESHAPVGTARAVHRVRLDGVGVEPGRLGFPQLVVPHTGAPDIVIDDRLDLASPFTTPSSPPTTLVTVTTPSQSSSEANTRARRFDAQLEDMEGFSVALACRLAEIPLTILRGVSNRAGDRDHRNWCIDDALASVSDLVRRDLELERGAS